MDGFQCQCQQLIHIGYVQTSNLATVLMIYINAVSLDALYFLLENVIQLLLLICLV